MKPTIITFSGKAQHGKDSSVGILKNLLEEKNIRVLAVNYAEYIKHLARQYFDWNGEKDEKGRSLLQWLGVANVNQGIPNFWVDNVIGITKLLEGSYDYVLIGDCRFPKDINRWEEEGYNVISVHVERLNYDNGLTEEQKNHPSEVSLDDFEFTVKLKVETLEELEVEIARVLEGLILLI